VTSSLRSLSRDDLDGVWGVLEHAFGGATHPSDRDVEFALVDDPARFYGGYDGDLPVAAGGSFALSMTVPGGPRPVAGVTWVGVLPTHRRRGLLTSLMRRLLEDLHAAGEPVAALWASQGAIYQRFGYGPASWDLALSVPSGAVFTRPVDAGGLRLCEPSAAVLAPAYDRVVGTRVGWYSRDEAWWAHRLADPEHRRGRSSQLRAVVTDGDGGIDGYAVYATEESWGPTGPTGTVHVRELVAGDPATTARLWRYLLDLDLMSTVRIRHGALDEPILHLLAEPRAAVPTLTDALWVRLVDVPAALSARSYATDIDVVLEVTDDVCPWNARRWRLTGGPSGATCAPSSDAPDLRLAVADLGAAYLGGTTLLARAGAGQVIECREGALATASTAFGWAGPAPHCPLVF
jgi:predicted acetyltransferase